MAYDLSKAIGHSIEAKPVCSSLKWLSKSSMIYRRDGIGVTFCFMPLALAPKPATSTLCMNWVSGEMSQEKQSLNKMSDADFAVFPTYPVVLNFRGDSQDVIDFNANFKSQPIPGLPPLNPARVVHATMSTEILRPLPTESGEGWKLTNRIIGVHENKSGIITENEIMLVDSQGTPYTRMIFGSFHLGAKATGKPFSKAIIRAPTAKQIPDRKADYVMKETTSPEQAVLYRLSGDYNPLHIDPRIGDRAGFGGVILHGLGTYGFAARAIISQVGGNETNSLKAIAGRFTSPVKPGDTLETSIWEMGPGPNGTVEVSFVCKNLNSGKVAISNGVAHIIRKAMSRL